MNAELDSILLEASGEILLLVDAVSLHILAANLTACSLLGYAKADLVGKPITDIECALSDVFFWEEVRQGSHSMQQNAEGMYQQANGELLPVVKTVSRPASEEGLITVCAREITHEKRAEQELALKTSQLRATLEATADGILVVDLQRRIINMNRHFSHMWQIPDALLVRHEDGKLLDFILSRLKDPAWYEQRQAQIRENIELESFDTLELLDGQIFECKSRPSRHGEQIIGRVYCFTDVTLRHQSEQALITARDAATAANRAKGEFLAMISHEIRTPMNGILGMSQLLENTPLTDEQKDYVQTMRSAGETLLAIINDVLDYSKIEARRLQLEDTPFRLDTLFEDLGRLFSVLARDKGLAYTMELAPDTPCALTGDPVRLRQILVNLIGNAIKFTSQGEIRVQARLIESDAAYVRLHFSVRDTGIGIPADKQDRIFTPFEQADMSTTRRFGGTGLGLSICRMLCELMGGHIGLDSQTGKGSDFWFEIRLGISGQSYEPATVPPEEITAVPEQARILVVEDNSINILVLTNLLKKLGGQHVSVAKTGCEALDVCQEQRFDLIFMDTHMPEMDGLEATRQLRAKDLQTYIIGVSADAMSDDRSNALATGMNDYITKPVSLTSLRKALELWRNHSVPAGA